MATSVKLDDDMKSRIQCLADALHAWTAYQSNGLHLTLEEANDWLAKLEAGEDAELPKCHD